MNRHLPPYEQALASLWPGTCNLTCSKLCRPGTCLLMNRHLRPYDQVLVTLLARNCADQALAFLWTGTCLLTTRYLPPYEQALASLWTGICLLMNRHLKTLRPGTCNLAYSKLCTCHVFFLHPYVPTRAKCKHLLYSPTSECTHLCTTCLG